MVKHKIEQERLLDVAAQEISGVEAARLVEQAGKIGGAPFSARNFCLAMIRIDTVEEDGKFYTSEMIIKQLETAIREYRHQYQIASSLFFPEKYGIAKWVSSFFSEYFDQVRTDKPVHDLTIVLPGTQEEID